MIQLAFFLVFPPCFDFNHFLGCVYPTLYIIRILVSVFHVSLLICYPCSSMFIILWKKVLSRNELVSWCSGERIVNSISLPNLHKGFKASWKQCLNLCWWIWLTPRHNLVKSLIPRGLWISKILFAQDHMKFRRLFLKVLKLAEFLTWKSSLFHADMAGGKNEYLK